MKALVTGGGGFLGRAIVRRLRGRGCEVRILARSEYPDLAAGGVDCRRGDLGDAAAVREACAGVDAVFHVAAKAGIWGKYDEFFQANVTGTQNVLDACRSAGVRQLIYTSTPSVVYNGLPLAGANESLPLTGKCPCAYPVTKAEAERRVLAANDKNLKTVALRPHLIWGAGDNHLVPRVVARARAGKLRIVGDGKNRVDLTHVENAAHAHLCAFDRLDAVAGKAFFLSDDSPVALWDWINDLLKTLGIPPVTRHVGLGTAKFAGAGAEFFWKILRLAGEPPMTRFAAVELAKDHWFDISAAKKELGYAPVVSPEKGLSELVEFLRAENKSRRRQKPA